MTASITFISAGAGSGKTHRLTDILYSRLSSGEVRPSGVIATTFTRKAAAELRERARSHLMGKGAFALAAALDYARIGTVNSVCGELLVRFAFEAGLPTEQQVLPEPQAKLLLNQALGNVTQGPRLTALIAVADRLGLESWRDDLKLLIDHARSNQIDLSDAAAMAQANAHALLEHFPTPSEEDLDTQLIAALDLALMVLQRAAQTSTKKNTTKCISILKEMHGKASTRNMAWSEWVRLTRTYPEKALQEVVQPVHSIAGRHVSHPRLHADIREFLHIMFEVCAQVVSEYDRRKRELGMVDFVDQEVLLLQALDNVEVQAALREELDLLLVDEFQDTSPIQLALFLKLASIAREVCWVGDVKQAIYGFRGSDTALMEAVLNSLPSIGGIKQVLDTSRRSRPPLVALVNAAFSDAFAPMLAPHEVQLKPYREESDTGAGFANWVLHGKTVADRIDALTAGVHRLIASGYQVVDREIEEVRPARFRDIAVLAKSNQRVLHISIALTKQGIPAATAQPGLLKRPEAVLALACLRRLNDAKDTVATAEILSLAACQEPETWLENRLRFLEAGGKPHEWQESGEAAYPLIARLAMLRTKLPGLAPREALELVITQGDLPRLVLGWSADREVSRVRLANLDALVELAAQYEDACRSNRNTASVSGLLRWLTEQSKQELDTLAEPDLDAVKVLTHHGAKGLEWPIVILMDLESEVKDRLWSISARSQHAVNLARPLQGRYIRYWPWPWGKLQSVPLADEIALSAAAAAVAREAVDEAKRLLYVSMTRARDMLILARSGNTPRGAWIDTLQAPWLLAEQGCDKLILPDTTLVPYLHWELTATEMAQSPDRPPEVVHWFSETRESTARVPLTVNPSEAAPVAVNVVEKVQLGSRIVLATGVEMTHVGLAIHACIAAAMSSVGQAISTDEIKQVLSNWGLEKSVSADQVISQAQALGEWIARRWPGAEILCEVPVSVRLENGQVAKGQIDLLLETQDGYVLIDHKANLKGSNEWEEVARRYGGQLSMYKQALEAATLRPVTELWLYFPVSGGAVSIQVQPADGIHVSDDDHAAIAIAV